MSGDIASHPNLGPQPDAKRAWLSDALGVNVPPAKADASTPTSLRMRDEPPKSKLQKDADDAAKKVIGTSIGVPRAQVERALKDFLRALASSHKSQSVQMTDKVWMAEQTLRKGLSGAGVVKRGDSIGADPDELAHKIAANLPDTIPGENYSDFLKLKPVEVPDGAGSTKDQIRKKYEEARDELVMKFPKAAQALVKKGIDAAVEKGVPFVVDKAMKEAGIDSKAQEIINKFVDEYSKKISGGGKDQ